MVHSPSHSYSDYVVSSDHDFFSSTMPVVREIKYYNINNDKRLKKKVISYFIDKATNWVENDYRDALTKYFKFINGKLVIDADIQEKSMTSDEKDKIVEHVVKYYITKSTIGKVISKIHHTKNINWYDMRDHKSYIRKSLYKKIKKYIVRSI